MARTNSTFSEDWSRRISLLPMYPDAPVTATLSGESVILHDVREVEVEGAESGDVEAHADLAGAGFEARPMNADDHGLVEGERQGAVAGDLGEADNVAVEVELRCYPKGSSTPSTVSG